MVTVLRWLFHLLAVRPLVLVGLGLNVHHRRRLPVAGPAIIIANHNSHVDTFVLMTLFPMACLKRLRAAAAADYFLRNRILAWISLNLFGIIPIKRGNLTRGDGNPLDPCSAALERGETLIIYPEGSRGEPERLAPFKSGIAHLARRHPDVPVVPVFLHGLGRMHPKGAFWPVPFVCDVVIGRPLRWKGWTGDGAGFTRTLAEEIRLLAGEVPLPEWR